MPIQFKTKLRGVTASNEDGQSRQEIIDYFIEPGDELVLMREPNNAADKNAIAVYVSKNSNDLKVGYLSADLADRYAYALDNNTLILTLVVIEKTGEVKGTFGVNCYFEAWTHKEIKEQEDRVDSELTALSRKRKLSRYQIKTWRIIVGLILLFTFVVLLFAAKPPIGEFLFMFTIFFIPSVFLLLPWVLWLFDSVKLIIDKLKTRHV